MVKDLNLGYQNLFIKVNGKSLLEYLMNAFSKFYKIKKTVIVYNKKHKKHLNQNYILKTQ